MREPKWSRSSCAGLAARKSWTWAPPSSSAGPGDAGILHLDGHLLAGLQAGAVDLAERGGGEGAGGELGEDLVGGAAELVVDVLAQEGEVHGRRLEVQVLERIDDLVGHD